MEAETRPTPSPSPEKKKPLSDRTNIATTVPTSIVLRKLTTSLSSAPPRSKLLPLPNPNSKKPYNSTSLAKKRLHKDCSESETSIGSSNFDEIGPNPSSITHPLHSPLGNRSHDLFEPWMTYSRKKPPENTKRNGKLVSVPLAISLSKKTRMKGKAVAESSNILSAGKAKGGKVNLMAISCNSLVTRNQKKKNVEPVSCPPLLRTRRKSTTESNEAGNFGLSHSHTVPHPKHKKKSRLLPEQDDSVHDLSPEFIQQQRAYFREVDSFELPVEEASDTESDNEDGSKGTLTK